MTELGIAALGTRAAPAELPPDWMAQTCAIRQRGLVRAGSGPGRTPAIIHRAIRSRGKRRSIFQTISYLAASQVVVRSTLDSIYKWLYFSRLAELSLAEENQSGAFRPACPKGIAILEADAPEDNG